MKVSFWKALGLVSVVADELTKAGADNRISVEESMIIAKNVGMAHLMMGEQLLCLIQ